MLSAEPWSVGLRCADIPTRDGIYLGVAGMSSSSLIGTSSGVVRVIDYRLAPGGRWRKDLVENMQTSFEEYVATTTSEPGCCYRC